MQIMNFSDPLNRWSLDTLKMVCDKVKGYTLLHGIENAELLSVEDNTWSDKENQRYDVKICYNKDNGSFVEQKLLILKGKVIDGKEFHERYDEFYGGRKLA